MKLSTLLQIIGSGSILLVVGIGLLLLGAGIGLSEALHLPMWATFCGLGLLTAIIGVTMIDQGTDEAEIQVAKKMPLMSHVIRNPWVIAGSSILGGIILQRLFRGRRDVVIEKIVPTAFVAAAQPSPVYPQHAESPPSEEGFSISKYLSDHLRTFGTEAASAALALGLEAAGVPTVEQLIHDLLNGGKKTAPSTEESAPAPDESSNDNFSSEPQYTGASSHAQAMQTSHNGYGLR